MSLEKVRMGSVEISRLAIGGNPFSGFSHQGPQRDHEMRRYYTVARIKEALFKAQAAGINTFFGRTDNHVIRMLEEYWSEGGKIQWIAQTASEIADPVRSIHRASDNGAKGCYLHGGQVDVYHRRGETDILGSCLETIRTKGMIGGFAGHRPEAHDWIRDHLRPDFQMCSYYDPSPRLDRPDHVSTEHERFDHADRDRMAQTIVTLPWPVVHYKVLAAGRTPADEAFRYVARIIAPKDIVLVGFHLGDDGDLITKTAKLFEQIVPQARQTKAA